MTSASGWTQHLYLHCYIGKIKSFIEEDNFVKDNVEAMELIDKIISFLSN